MIKCVSITFQSTASFERIFMKALQTSSPELREESGEGFII